MHNVKTGYAACFFVLARNDLRFTQLQKVVY